MNKDIFSLGALVQVKPECRSGRKNSEGGLGYVLSVNETERTVDVSYTVSGTLSQEIQEERLEVASLAVTARRRTNSESKRPSLLSVAHRETYSMQQQYQSSKISHQQTQRSNVKKGLALELQEARSWSVDSKKSHPVFHWFHQH